MAQCVHHIEIMKRKCCTFILGIGYQSSKSVALGESEKYFVFSIFDQRY